jgi:cellobiose-specific phosphotransferase system component IIC
VFAPFVFAPFVFAPFMFAPFVFAPLVFAPLTFEPDTRLEVPWQAAAHRIPRCASSFLSFEPIP